MSGTECTDLSHCECVDALYAEIKTLKRKLAIAREMLEECSEDIIKDALWMLSEGTDEALKGEEN